MHKYTVVILAVFCISCRPTPQSKMSESQIDSLMEVMHADIEADFNRYHFEPVFRYLDSIAILIDSVGDSRLFSAYYVLKGSMFTYRMQFDSAHYYSKLALRKAEQESEDNKFVIAAKTLQIKSFGGLKLYDSAIQKGLEAYFLAQKKDAALLPEINNSLSDVYSIIGDTLNRRKHLLEGYYFAKDPNTKLKLANGLAKYYFDKKMMDSVLFFYNRVIKDSVINKIVTKRIVFKSNIGIMLSQAGHYQEGNILFQEAINLLRYYGLVEEGAYMNLAENFSRQKEYIRSNVYNDSAIQITKSKNRFLTTSLLFKDVSKNLLKLSRPVEAYQALDSSLYYFAKNDSVAYLEKVQELETRYEVREKDEQIAKLAYANAVNEMARKQQRIIVLAIGIAAGLLFILGLLLWRRRQLRTHLREAELRQQLLHGKMEPHFVFNALSSLRGLVNIGEQQKASEYISELSQLLRLAFDHSTRAFIPLEEEINFLKHYLLLQKLQREVPFDYVMTIYSGFEQDEVLIPPMLLQPIIENALLHGFRNINYEGKLTMELSRAGNVLLCRIEDNGVGFSKSQGSVDEAIHAIAVVKQRLALISRITKQKGSLHIQDKGQLNRESGVLVTIEIPFVSSF